MAHRTIGTAFGAVLGLALVPPTHAATLYVANNGFDAVGCGTKTSPCRSIGQGIANAAAGDAVIVGPGRYGDLNFNSVLGDPGDENPGSYAPGCNCVVALNKPVSVTSSAGAAATVIEGYYVGAGVNVLLITNGGRFGKAGKGFTVTHTASSNPGGIGIDSVNVAVEGNQVIGQSMFFGGSSPGTGIGTVNSAGAVLIAGNQVYGWQQGINVRGTNKTVRKNVVTHNLDGIVTDQANVIVGNVVNANVNGIDVSGNAQVIGNALSGNRAAGVEIHGGTPTIEKNDLVGNSNCGVFNAGPLPLAFPNNYWGAATGPGPLPADTICPPGTGTATPAATKPFNVKVRIKP